MHTSKLPLIALGMSILLHAGEARGAEAVTIRASWIAPVTNWASLLLEKKELAQHLGRSYLFEPVRFVGRRRW
jgi:sulfonate transport system substrate-binding protein